MAKILIRSARLLALDDATLSVPTAIAIDGEVIVAVGAEPAGFDADEIVDASGHLVMPGLFNAHTHTGAVLSRGRTRGDIIPEPGGAEAAYRAAQLAMIEMIRSGVVGFADQYYYMDRVAEAVEQAGMRALLSWCTYSSAIPEGVGGDGEDGVIGGDLAAVGRFVEQWNGAGGGRIRTALGPHSVHRCSPMFLARSAAVAARLGVGIHVHVAVTPEEVDEVLAEHGMTPVELLDKNGVFGAPVTAIHAIHLTHVDIDLLSERGACVVYCPSAHVLQGLGRTPVELLSAAGVSVALGTDGADTAYTLDMFRAVRDATLCRTGPRGGDLDPLGALRLATREAASVLGFPLSGRLAPAHCADLVLIDLRRGHLTPLPDPVAGLVHAGGPRDVTDVMVGGRWLLRQGELQTIDEQEVLADIGNLAPF